MQNSTKPKQSTTQKKNNYYLEKLSHEKSHKTQHIGKIYHKLFK